ncbi:MAG: RNA polymerase sigma factor [Paramuribaculum sp.]|nr:RNA polymerase sigma factor [Paramuribaculum sp.]
METATFQSRLLDLRPKLLSFAYSLTKDKADAQRLLQATTEEVLDGKHKFNADTNFNGWVLTRMRSIFLNRTKGITRSVAVYDEAADCYQLNVEATAEIPQGTFAATDMAAAVSELDEMYSRPFNMYVSGYTNHEIARELNISVSAVVSRISYAQQHLQNSLG